LPSPVGGGGGAGYRCGHRLVAPGMRVSCQPYLVHVPVRSELGRRQDDGLGTARLREVAAAQSSKAVPWVLHGQGGEGAGRSWRQLMLPIW
jgi:hypothetical protein